MDAMKALLLAGVAVLLVGAHEGRAQQHPRRVAPAAVRTTVLAAPRTRGASSLAARVVLRGRVRIGPLTPVCRAGTPCDGPAGRVTLTFTRTTAARHVTTDAAGAYRISLTAGRWMVRANRGLRITPSTIAVTAPAARRDFSIDTGIR